MILAGDKLRYERELARFVVQAVVESLM